MLTEGNSEADRNKICNSNRLKHGSINATVSDEIHYIGTYGPGMERKMEII